jgi:hypothetical protein
VIKVNKRNELAIVAQALQADLPAPTTVTATVNDWIAESRKNKLEQDKSSRKTIAGWTEAND